MSHRANGSMTQSLLSASFVSALQLVEALLMAYLKKIPLFSSKSHFTRFVRKTEISMIQDTWVYLLNPTGRMPASHAV